MFQFNFFKRNLALEDVVFEGRNRSYGAYDLRYREGQFLSRAIVITFSIFIAGSAAFIVLSGMQRSALPAVPPSVIADLSLVDPIVEPVKPKALSQAVTTAPIRTFNNQLPVPTAAPADELKNTIPDAGAVPGIEDHNGPVAKQASSAAPVIAPPASPAPMPQPLSDNPYIKVDKEAKFIGGIDAFRHQIQNNFDSGSMTNAEGVISTIVTFVVEKDGTISNLKATGGNKAFNQEAVKTVRSVRGKWIPAEVKGQPVRSYFRIPISMQFDF